MLKLIRPKSKKDLNIIDQFNKELVEFENKIDDRLIHKPRNMQKEHYELYLINFKNSIIGFLEYKKQKELYKYNKNTIVLTKIIINKNYRNRGLGKKTIYLLIKQLKKQKIDYIIVPYLYKNKIAKNFWNSFSDDKYVEEILIRVKK